VRVDLFVDPSSGGCLTRADVRQAGRKSRQGACGVRSTLLLLLGMDSAHRAGEAAGGRATVLAVGTFDTKAEELRRGTALRRRLERGKAEPSISTLKQLANALGRSITYFFTSTPRVNGHVVCARTRRRLALRGHSGDPRSLTSTSGACLELVSRDEAQPPTGSLRTLRGCS
jgi:transcriptional regulator with XRE-family HTH domain